MNRWFALFLIVLLGLFIYDDFKTRLVEAIRLNEITVEVQKLPDFTFHQWYCNNKYPDVTQAGPHLKCLRTDI